MSYIINLKFYKIDNNINNNKIDNKNTPFSFIH